jgi:hypothetical protein
MKSWVARTLRTNKEFVEALIPIEKQRGKQITMSRRALAVRPLRLFVFICLRLLGRPAIRAMIHGQGKLVFEELTHWTFVIP